MTVPILIQRKTLISEEILKYQFTKDFEGTMGGKGHSYLRSKKRSLEMYLHI